LTGKKDKSMKKKIFEFLTSVWDAAEYRLRLLCGKPSPMKRFIVVLILGGALSLFFIYTLVSSIYNIGVQDAKKEFMELQHIEGVKLQSENESINILNQKENEYE